MSFVSLSIDENKVGFLTLQRPEVRNALNWESMDQFTHAIQEVEAVKRVRGLILSGSGEDFCTGGDLRELHPYNTFEDGLRLASEMTDTLQRLEGLPFPTIAAIEGYALGGGAEIALACDFRIMAIGATFGMIQMKLGLVPAWGGVHRLGRLVGFGHAKELCFTAKRLRAEDALNMGIAQRLAPNGQTRQVAQEFLSEIAAFEPKAIQTLKEMLTPPQALSARTVQKQQRQFATLWTSDFHQRAAKKVLANKQG
jgi:enoyl-CoA hydratase